MLGGQVVTHLIMKLAFDDLSFLIFFSLLKTIFWGGRFVLRVLHTCTHVSQLLQIESAVESWLAEKFNG